MFIRPELGGKGTGCLFQFTYCEVATAENFPKKMFSHPEDCFHLKRHLHFIINELAQRSPAFGDILTCVAHAGKG